MVLTDLKETNVLVHPPIYPWSVPLKDKLLTEILLPYIFGQLKHRWMWVNNLFIVPDFQPVKTYFVFSVHTTSMSLSAWHKTPAFCGQCCSRKTKPHCQLHMRTLWDPHVILMKGSTQMGYGFFFSFASFEEYQNFLFLFRGLSGIQMKICSMGISVKIRGMCTFFYSQAWTHPRGEDVSKYF